VNDNLLCRELSKRIFGNLGAVPGGFNKVGVTAKENIAKDRTLKIAEQGEYPIFAAHTSRSEQILLSNIGTEEVPEVVAVIEDDGVLVGIRFTWAEDDSGTYVAWFNDQWAPISLSHKLTLALIVENLTQDGELWEASKKCKPELFERLASLIEEVDTTEEVD
jgi:hypothetical protein